MNRAEKFQTEIGVKIGMLRNEQSRGLSRIDWKERKSVSTVGRLSRSTHVGVLGTEERLVRHTPSTTATTSDTGPHHLK